ncbi:hypothetical protein [Coraliomargarita akajimensis]|nr:hypothetical protein [Coraliomargarita akajimensis]
MVKSHEVETAARELTKAHFQPPSEYDPETNPAFAEIWDRYREVNLQLSNLRMSLERAFFDSSMSQHMHYVPEAFEAELSKNPDYKRLAEESKLLRRQVAPYYDAKKAYEASYRELAQNNIREYSQKYDLVIAETHRSNIHYSKQSERVDITDSIINHMRAKLSKQSSRPD